MRRYKNRAVRALALLLAATTLAGCGCGPFGLNWCGHRGGGYYGRGPGYYRGPGYGGY